MDAIHAHHDLEISNNKRYGTCGCKKLLESPQYAHTSQLACELLQCINDDTNKGILAAKKIYEEGLDRLEEMPDLGPEFLDMNGQIGETALKRYSEEMLAWLPDIRIKQREINGRIRMAELQQKIVDASEATGQLTTRIDKLQEFRVRTVVKQVFDNQTENLGARMEGVQVQTKQTQLQLTSVCFLLQCFPRYLPASHSYKITFS